MRALPPDVQSLLDAEKRTPGPSQGAEERVRHRLEATLGIAVAATATAAATASAATTTAAAATTTTTTTAAAATTTTAGAATGAQAALVGGGKALLLKLLLAAGGAAFLGGGAYVALRPRAPVSLSSSAPPGDRSEPRLPPLMEKAVTVPQVARPAHAHPPQLGLADEQAFLEEARAALRNGSPDRALQLLAQHERAFPAAQMGDARESLAIQALVAQQREGAARARAAEFHRRYPRSLFLPAVDASLHR